MLLLLQTLTHPHTPPVKTPSYFHKNKEMHQLARLAIMRHT